jgi:hypothetical protein
LLAGISAARPDNKDAFFFAARIQMAANLCGPDGHCAAIRTVRALTGWALIFEWRGIRRPLKND